MDSIVLFQVLLHFSNLSHHKYVFFHSFTAVGTAVSVLFCDVAWLGMSHTHHLTSSSLLLLMEFDNISTTRANLNLIRGLTSRRNIGACSVYRNWSPNAVSIWDSVDCYTTYKDPSLPNCMYLYNNLTSLLIIYTFSSTIWCNVSCWSVVGQKGFFDMEES